MSSKVAPYFILTAEKVVDRNEIKELQHQHIDSLGTDVPTTPPCSRVTDEIKNSFDDYSSGYVRRRKKGYVKYKIPVKEVRRKENLNRKMELIKEKLEMSRERFKEQKQKHNDLTITCEPTQGWFDPNKKSHFAKMDDSDQNDGKEESTNENKKADGQPYVYFVVSDDANEAKEKIKMKHSAKRRSALKERNSSNKGRTSANIIGLAREIGLKSNIEVKPESRQCDTNKASVNHIVFPSTSIEAPKPQFPNNPKGLRSIPSPPRIPPCTPANSGENKIEFVSHSLDADETVPRKPFLSSPMYGGKTRGMHSASLQHFDLPTISADQKRRALGLGTKFEEFAYPKPQSEQRQRKVSFADPLPVIRGSGFVLSSSSEMKENLALETPSLGPRAVTMGSITLPSEQTNKQTICQKYLSGESISTSKNVRKSCVPLQLPKIDIVSNVYDEMIIKMIQEYLQDSNTPSRQSQLARELLVHLQKHNEHMKELNVPNVNKKNKTKLTKAVHEHRQKVQELINSNANSTVPPNTAEETIPKSLTPSVMLPDVVNDDGDDLAKTDDDQRSFPFVQITFKSKTDEANESRGDNRLTPGQPSYGGSASRERKSQNKPILSVVTPVSFQMAPPGLSREDSFMSIASMKA